MWAQLPAPGLLRLLSLKWPTYFELSSSLVNTHPMEPCQGKKKLGAFSIFRPGLSILWCKLLGPGYQVRAQAQSISCLEHFCKEMFAAAKLRQQPEKVFFSLTRKVSFFFEAKQIFLKRENVATADHQEEVFFVQAALSNGDRIRTHDLPTWCHFMFWPACHNCGHLLTNLSMLEHTVRCSGSQYCGNQAASAIATFLVARSQT